MLLLSGRCEMVYLILWFRCSSAWEPGFPVLLWFETVGTTYSVDEFLREGTVSLCTRYIIGTGDPTFSWHPRQVSRYHILLLMLWLILFPQKILKALLIMDLNSRL